MKKQIILYLLPLLLSFLPNLCKPLPVMAVKVTPTVQMAELEEEELEYLRMYFDKEMLVEAPTHYPKSIMEIAENVTVITAEDIKAMNARNIPEVLNRAAGIFLYIDFPEDHIPQVVCQKLTKQRFPQSG